MAIACQGLRSAGCSQPHPIERYCRTDAGRPSPSAEPPLRFHNQAIDARIGEAPPRGDTGCTATDDRRLLSREPN
jgi:hypothetical protein